MHSPSQQDLQGGAEANSCWMDHGAEVGHKMPPSPYRQQGQAATTAQMTLKEREPVLPLTKDSPDRLLLESALKVEVERGKNE